MLATNVDFLLMLLQPKGGIPDPNLKPDDMLLANVPIYGTAAAGRGLYFRVRTLLIENGMVENFVIPALYSFARDGIVLIMFGTHVDDLLYAYVDEVKELMANIMSQMIFGKYARIQVLWKRIPPRPSDVRNHGYLYFDHRED